MTKKQQRALWLLNNIPLGALQSGYERKIPVPKHSKMVRVYINRIEGLNIPASTLSRFRSGEFTPSQKTIDKLEKMYRRYAYNEAAAHGMKIKEARRWQRLDPDMLVDRIKKMSSIIKSVADEKDTTMENIVAGMRFSQKDTVEDWEQYVREKK